MNKYIVVDYPEKWSFSTENVKVISSQDYLTNPAYALEEKARIFNLCKDYSYQSKGYYVSLLAEARGHLPLPTTSNIVDLKAMKLIRIVSEDFDEDIQKSLKKVKTQEFTLSVYFGQNVAKKYNELSSLFFRHFQAPLLRVKFNFTTKWHIQSIKTISTSEIPADHLDLMYEAANEYFAKKRYDKPKATQYDFDLAILVNPNDPAPPSNEKALKKFIDLAEKMHIYAEIVGPKDISKLNSYDALFIRQSTEVNNEAYTFARKALQDGIAIVDYPDAILKCCNKVFMAEALENANIDTPKTRIIHKNNKNQVLEYIGLPCVLKSPDSTFSFGVKKAKTKKEYEELITEMLKTSDLIIAQEFCPSDYDWRIGILDGKAFYACRYYMADGHWQIYNWDAKGDDQLGNADCLPIEKVPKKVIQMAIKSAKLMGSGLYGIDIKVVNEKPMVIEINDNPNIDAGVEDAHYGDLIYNEILSALKKRVGSSTK